MITSRSCWRTWKAGRQTFCPAATTPPSPGKPPRRRPLTAALNDDQRDLLLTWEDARNAADDLYQSALLRQAFLLGREVVR